MLELLHQLDYMKDVIAIETYMLHAASLNNYSEQKALARLSLIPLDQIKIWII